MLIHRHDVTRGKHRVALFPHASQELLPRGLLIVDVRLEGLRASPGGQFNSFVEISTDFSTEFSEFL